MHLVTRAHFRSRDEDGGHTIRSAMGKKPHAARKLRMDVSVKETDLLPIAAMVLRWNLIVLNSCRPTYAHIFHVKVQVRKVFGPHFLSENILGRKPVA